MTDQTTRLVLDTNVLVSALFWDGNERRILLDCVDGPYQLVTSPFILEELEHVLVEKFGALEDKVDTYLRLLLVEAEIVDPGIEVTALPDDPADNRILACAKAAQAEALVTGDQVLLDLKTWEEVSIRTASDLLAG